MESIAKIFQNGRSQAVRLPKAFRFKGNEVKISKNGDKVILEPLERSRWPEGFWDAFPVEHLKRCHQKTSVWINRGCTC